MADEPRLTIAQLKGKDLRTVHTIDWPGLPGKQVGLMELRCTELLEAYFAAREVFARKGWEALDQAAQPFFNEELELQYCYRMLVDPDARNPKFRIFASVDEARARLDPDERSYFAAQHVLMQNAKAKAWLPPAEQPPRETAE